MRLGRHNTCARRRQKLQRANSTKIVSVALGDVDGDCELEIVTGGHHGSDFDDVPAVVCFERNVNLNDGLSRKNETLNCNS